MKEIRIGYSVGFLWARKIARNLLYAVILSLIHFGLFLVLSVSHVSFFSLSRGVLLILKPFFLRTLSFDCSFLQICLSCN